MLEELPADNAIDLKTSLATCKLLDLMLALSMEEFQMSVLWKGGTDPAGLLLIRSSGYDFPKASMALRQGHDGRALSGSWSESGGNFDGDVVGFHRR